MASASWQADSDAVMAAMMASWPFDRPGKQGQLCHDKRSDTGGYSSRVIMTLHENWLGWQAILMSVDFEFGLRM